MMLCTGLENANITLRDTQRIAAKTAKWCCLRHTFKCSINVNQTFPFFMMQSNTQPTIWDYRCHHSSDIGLYGCANTTSSLRNFHETRCILFRIFSSFFLFAFPPVFSFQTALLKSLHLKHWSPSVPWCETLYSINSARSLQGNIEHLFWIAMFLPQQYHSVGLGFDFLLKHDEQLQSKRWGNSAIMFFFVFVFIMYSVVLTK